jgi:hypothetical protein
MSQPSRKPPVRSAADNIGIALSPAAGARARAAAAHYRSEQGDKGGTISAYFEALVMGQEMFPIPASHASLGACVLDALAALGRPEPDVPEAIRLLREAQRLGAEFGRAYLPAFDAAHAADDPEQSTDGRRV